MRKKSLSFLKALLDAPSPSGYEQPVQRVWRAYVDQFAGELRTDVHGNAIAAINPGGSPRIMLAGHCDELGFQINYISKKGFLHFKAIGGYDLLIVPGRRVVIHTRNGPVLGVIGKRAIHLMTDTERSRPGKPEIEKYWIDIAVGSKQEAKELVEIGDPVTYDVAFQEMRNGLANSRAFDDKAGAFVVAEALRLLAEDGSSLKAAVFGVSTVQEEVGLRGATTSAYGVNPDAGIAVDVTHATDSPDMDKRKAGDIKLGGGPVITRGANINPVVFERLVEAAKGAPYQIDAVPRGTGTDANAIQLTRGGVAAGLIGLPLRYMHTAVEMAALTDLEHSAKLLAAFCRGIDEDTSFIPE
jgi:tetrahedral aminopeptidase